MVRLSCFRIRTKATTIRTKTTKCRWYCIINVRSDRNETAVPKMLPLNPFTTTSGSTTITVREPDHGRSTSDTVRFRDAQNVGGVLGSTINSASGYSITKVNDDKYTFATATTSSITETGGGGSASAGPVTVQS